MNRQRREMEALARIALKGHAEDGETIDSVNLSGFQPLLRAVSKAMERAPYAAIQLAPMLRNRLNLSRDAFDRQAHLPGRILNRILGEEPYHVEVPGTALIQLLEAAFGAAPSGLSSRCTYLLRRDLAEDILSLLSEADSGSG